MEDITQAMQYENIDDETMGIALANMGTIYLNLKKYDEALEYLDKGIGMNDQLYWAYKSKAFIQMSKGESDEALVNINKGLNLKKTDAVLLYWKGLIKYKTGDEVTGCKYMQESFSLVHLVGEEDSLLISTRFRKYCKLD